MYSLLKEFADWARDGVDFHIAQYELFLWALRTPSARAFGPEMYRVYLALFEEYQSGQEGRAATAVREARITGESDPMALFVIGILVRS